jgi:hypothetical protein
MSSTNRQNARSHAALAHTWAQQTQDAQRSGPFHFAGPTLYSYRTPVARFMGALDERGATIVLFTARGYSATTAGKHLPPARDALRGLNVRVILVDIVPEHPETFGATRHAENLADIIARRDALVAKASRARIHADSYLSEAVALHADAQTYAAAFELPEPAPLDISADALADARERTQAAADAARDAIRARKEREAADRADRARRWRNGENVGASDISPTMLRLRERGDVIETSRGARVPSSVARELVPMMIRARKASRSFWPQTPQRVGDYVLNEIRADGALVIGCHVLEVSEVSAFLASLDGATRARLVDNAEAYA